MTKARVLVCAPDRSGRGYLARRTRQHLQVLRGSGWAVDLLAAGDTTAARPDVVLAVGWSAAGAAAAASHAPLLVDVGELQFPVAARLALAGADPSRALDDAFGDLIAGELAACAGAAATIAATHPEAEMLDDFLGRPGWTAVVPPLLAGGCPAPVDHQGLVFVADPSDAVDAAATGWLQHRLAPRLQSAVADPVIVTEDIGRLTTARVVLVPPALGARGYDLAVRAVVAGVPVVAPVRVAEALPLAARSAVQPAEDEKEFLAAVSAAVAVGASLPTSVGSALVTTHAPTEIRRRLLAVLERVVPGSAP